MYIVLFSVTWLWEVCGGRDWVQLFIRECVAVVRNMRQSQIRVLFE